MRVSDIYLFLTEIGKLTFDTMSLPISVYAHGPLGD
jgi:hypothetical protein